MKKQSNKELENLEKRITFKFELKLEEFERRITEKFVHFKDEFYVKIDPILKEVIASREERAILTHQIIELRNKVDHLLKK